MKAFTAPDASLGDLDADAAAMLLVAASDIAIVVDQGGVVRDVAIQSDDLARALEGYEAWLGRHWNETVTADSRPKVAQLLREASSTAPPRWRHLNQVAAGRNAVPLLFAVVPLGDRERFVALGRDLRPIWELQQKLLDAQHSMERDYARLRLSETRYRLLFEMSAEPVLVLDSNNGRIAELNPAARSLFGEHAGRLPGRPFAAIFTERSGPAVESLLASVRASGRADDVRAVLAEGEREVVIAASMLRQEGAPLFLVRLLPASGADANALPKMKSKLLKLVESAPDGFVVTGADGLVITANAAFLDLAQLASEEQARGESLDRWLGRPGVDLNVMIANLRQRGSMRLFATTMRGELGAPAEVEISAVTVMNGGQPCYGFAIRMIGPRLTAPQRAPRELPRSVEQLTELIGRMSLKELVREATDVIERLCIETALEITGDNRASAAEMLGLSRQSLYTKLRRYGMADPATEES